ncbi:MAG TPA: OmpA family protein [Chthonomonadaceae bacterium]|nr:OmpA family protein [Chthonomonadaceae bacterium]
MLRTNQHAERPENLERWLLTYADMITLLTAFFLMLYSMSVMSRGKFTQLATSVRSGFGGAVYGGASMLNGGGAHTLRSGILPDSQQQSYQEAMGNLRRYVEQHHLNGKVSTREDRRGVIISLVSDGMLFARGQAELGPGSVEVLSRVARILRSVPNDVAIEGHTCDLPIRTAQFPSNWELSTARAGTVLRYLTEKERLPSGRFMAAGYAETRPLAPNSSEANRARNRRVDIVILRTDAQREADLQRRAELRRIAVDEAPELEIGGPADSPSPAKGSTPPRSARE